MKINNFRGDLADVSVKKAALVTEVTRTLYSIRSWPSQVRDIEDNKDERIIAPNGVVVPPFIVLACGQAFDEWVRSISPDFPLALQVSHSLWYTQQVRTCHCVGLCLLLDNNLNNSFSGYCITAKYSNAVLKKAVFESILGQACAILQAPHTPPEHQTFFSKVH